MPNDQLLQNIRHAWPPEEWQAVNLAVALSGGADSVALLRVLWQLKQQHGGSGQLAALHVNHQIRGRDSDADAAWCQEQCQALGIPCQVLQLDTAQLAAQTGDGMEAAARSGRYRLLTEAAEKIGARYLVTAHTQDDQVETILFRILRGTGLRGLTGIPRTRSLTASLTLIRPLLDCSREMIVNYLTTLGQEYRTDQSNTDEQFTRNRLRHELLPKLRDQYNADLDNALLRLSSQASDAQQLLESQAQTLLQAAQPTRHDASLSLLQIAFQDQPTIIVCEALRIAWREAELSEQAMTHQWWQRLAALTERSSTEKVLNLPGKVRASIAEDQLRLEW